MSTVQLNERERLIERILHMPDAQVTELAELIETLAADPTWSDEGITADELERRNMLDLAEIVASKGEPTRPLDDILHELNIE